MRKHLIRFCSFLLIIGGLILLFNKPIINYFVTNTGAAYELSQLSKEDLEENQNRSVSFDFDRVQSIRSEDILKSQLNKSKEELPVIAGIAIPSVKIRLPIFKGLSNEALLYGAGTLSPDQEMGKGNYSLASHRSDQADLLFTPLEKLAIGAEIYVTDLTKVYTYKAITKERVAPTALEVLDEVPDKQLITLITCGDLYGTDRLVVQGELVDEVPMKQMSKQAAEAFKLPVRSY